MINIEIVDFKQKGRYGLDLVLRNAGDEATEDAHIHVSLKLRDGTRVSQVLDLDDMQPGGTSQVQVVALRPAKSLRLERLVSDADGSERDVPLDVKYRKSTFSWSLAA